MAKKRSKRARSKRKHQHAPKGNVVWKQTAEEATLASKPYINAYACGHGVQGDTKYNRTREKRAWKRDLQEGASRGSFLFSLRNFAARDFLYCYYPFGVDAFFPIERLSS